MGRQVVTGAVPGQERDGAVAELPDRDRRRRRPPRRVDHDVGHVVEEAVDAGAADDGQGRAAVGGQPWVSGVRRRSGHRGVKVAPLPSRPSGHPYHERVTAAPVTTRILVVDDDVQLAGVVARHLVGEGHAVNVATDGPGGLHLALETLPDLVVLDAGLPGLDGVTLCRQIREVAPIPVIMLTDRAADDDRLLGPGPGADDYLTKPVSTTELAARVGALLRRAAGEVGVPGSGTAQVGEVELDLVTREVTRHGEPVPLSAREVDLLAFFARHPGRNFTCEELLASVWGWTFDDTATVTVHVRRLRQEVEPDPTEPQHLVAHAGGGYRYEP